MNKLELFPSLVYIQNLETDIDSYINYLYLLKKDLPGRKISNRGGWQSDELIDNPYFTSLIKEIQYRCSKIYNINYKIIEIWANISPQYSYNQIHTHSSHGMNLISGILYLKVPPNSGSLILYNPSNVSQFNEIYPEDNNLIFFNSSLPHSVNLNLSKYDRISIAFNLVPNYI